MRALVRPPKPAKFEARVKASRDAVRRRIETNGKLDEGEFDPKWSEFKGDLSTAQRCKCGWCERDAIGADYGQVDHFRPKGRIDELREGAWRKEVAKDEANVETQAGAVTTLSALGYWWLAYEWTNLVLICRTCNGSWKRCFFPARRGWTKPEPGCELREQPLLLNPYETTAIGEHLRFTFVGGAEPRTDEGRETLRIMGLNRPSLLDRRRRRAEEISRDLSILLREDVTQREEDDAHYRLARKLHDDEEFCGMARLLVESRMGVEFLNQLLALLADNAAMESLLSSQSPE